ncbi:MAG: DUF885 domain-containing protein, partial [Sphingomonadaceae bacterium]|nr:DUF885 domain-containing protein [Sphingomonadaceae bacterium]
AAIDGIARPAYARLRAAIAGLGCAPRSREALQVDVVRATLRNALRSAGVAYGTINPFGFVNHAPYLVSQISGPHIDTPATMAGQQSLRTPAAIDAWIAKLEGFGAGFDGVIDKVRADEAAGCIPPRALLEKTLPVLDAFIAGPVREHPLIVALHAGMAAAVIDSDARERFEARAIAAIDGIARPAYARLRAAIADMVPRGRTESGVWAQPRGEEVYAANVLALGDSTLTPDEIHQRGLDEIERITAEMGTLLAGQELMRGSVAERMLALSGDPAQLFPDSDAGRQELLEYVRSLVRGAEGRYEEFLPTAMIPPQAMQVRRVPVPTQDSAPGGFYDSPSLDGTRPGTYWINLRDMAAVARFTLPTLSYHEGVPGHHTQSAIASGLGEAPLLIRIASFNAYQEGWALYSERLMAELGAYADDPYGDLGRLQDELFRAIRLVVDTGLHHKRWTREQAIAFMRSASGNPESSVVAEIERYMAWPGQALGYKLGQLRLLAMRDTARERAGAGFDIRDFHAAVLGEGAMPLAMIEQRPQA